LPPVYASNPARPHATIAYRETRAFACKLGRKQRFREYWNQCAMREKRRVCELLGTRKTPLSVRVGRNGGPQEIRTHKVFCYQNGPEFVIE
jgi:uncharacterized protein YceH (UPF0502 family)